MSAARRELDRLSHEAWHELSADARRCSSRFCEFSGLYARRHPGLVIGAGAFAALLAFSMFRRPRKKVVERPEQRPVPEKPKEKSFLTSALGNVARMWLIDALSTAGAGSGSRGPAEGE